MMYDLLAAVGAKVVINWLVFVPATVLVLLQYPELKFVTYSSLTILLQFFAASVGGGGDAACERELVSCYISPSIIELIQEKIL